MDDLQRPIRHANEFWDHYGAYAQTIPEAGDLVFFSRHGLFPTHIGIMKDEVSYIHAPGNKHTKVVIEDMTEENIVLSQNMGRILFQTNPIGFKAPTVVHNSPTYRHHQQVAK
jgi:cell wall-associated NlpC family hydrolase